MTYFMLSSQTSKSPLLPLLLADHLDPHLVLLICEECPPLSALNLHTYMLLLRSSFYCFLWYWWSRAFSRKFHSSTCSKFYPSCLVIGFSSSLILSFSSINKLFFIQGWIPSWLTCSRLLHIECVEGSLSQLHLLPNSYYTVCFLSWPNFPKICLNVRSPLPYLPVIPGPISV